MIFGRTDEERILDRGIKQAQRDMNQQTSADQRSGTWWAWRPVRLRNGRWVVWQTIWRKVELKTVRPSEVKLAPLVHGGGIDLEAAAVTGRRLNHNDIIIGERVTYALTREEI